jgi:hypothetical protein
MGINHRKTRHIETFHPFSITRNEGTMNSLTQNIPKRQETSRRNRAYSEIYEQIAAGNEKHVSALLLCYRDVLTVGDAYDLMQTALCTIAAKKAFEAGAWA